MFKKILVPLDLTESDAQKRALSMAIELAKSHGAELHAVSIGSDLPNAVARTEADRSSILSALVADLHANHGIKAIAHEIHSVDPSAEMDKLLMESIDEFHVDLVVMSTRVPGMMEYFFPAHAGYIASHAKISVFLVR